MAGLPESTGLPSAVLPPRAVVIGASAGGPQALERLLAALPRGFSVPVAVCQHMPLGFVESFAWRLGRMCSLRVKQAEDGEPFLRGGVYVAPSGKHMRLRRSVTGNVAVRLDDDFADSLFVPSIDMLMSSAAQVYGSGAVAVLLTGLCSDGAMGMLAVRRAGGHTICESPDSAAVSSMPLSALAAGGVAETLPLAGIGPALAALAARR